MSLSVIQLRNLMLEAMGDESLAAELYDKHNFNNTHGAADADLFRLTELLAIKYKLIDDKIPIGKSAWGCPGSNLFALHNTNFNKVEIERLWEAFYFLLNNNIIAPGMYRNSNHLPYFHITEYGKKCIENRDVLPYDVDGYLNNMKNIEKLDEWVEFYIEEALRCYNSRYYNAATAMIGLSSERLVEIVLNNFADLLGKTRYKISIKDKYKAQYPKIKNQVDIQNFFKEKLSSFSNFSQRYKFFYEFYPKLAGLPINIRDYLDNVSITSFTDYLRTSRNEVSHPVEIKKDEIEVLLMFIGFSKYCVKYSALNNELLRLQE